MKAPAPEETIAVTVINPDERVWEGRAYSVSSVNSAGPFDILPEHANFVTMIRNQPVIVRTIDHGEKTFTYKNAVITVNDNKVSIYTEI